MRLSREEEPVAALAAPKVRCEDRCDTQQRDCTFNCEKAKGQPAGCKNACGKFGSQCRDACKRQEKKK